MPELLRMPWLRASPHAARGGDADRPAARRRAFSVVGATAAEPASMLTPAERRQRHVASPLLRLSEDYQRRKVRQSSSTCQCSGNCRHWKHRQDGRCSNRWLMVGSDYCATCVCDVQGCVKPKAKSPYCHLHGNIFSAAPLPVQLAVLAADLAPLLVPCDIMAWSTAWHGTDGMAWSTANACFVNAFVACLV